MVSTPTERWILYIFVVLLFCFVSIAIILYLNEEELEGGAPTVFLFVTFEVEAGEEEDAFDPLFLYLL